MSEYIVVEWEDEEGIEHTTRVPAVYELCPRCEGKGKHVNPSIDEHGITQEEFDRDPDFKEEYMLGAYDITCIECSGLRVVKVFDYRANLTDEQRAAIEVRNDALRFEAEWRNEIRRERLMLGEY